MKKVEFSKFLAKGLALPKKSEKSTFFQNCCFRGGIICKKAFPEGFKKYTFSSEHSKYPKNAKNHDFYDFGLDFELLGLFMRHIGVGNPRQ